MKNRLPLKIVWLLPLLLAFQVYALSSSRAEEPDCAALQARIKSLELRVKELESMLGGAEGALRTDTQPGAPGWQNRKNWKRLSLGMKEAEVRGVLGEPSKVIQGVKTLWYYPNFYRGYLTFDEQGRLIGWNEP